MPVNSYIFCFSSIPQSWLKTSTVFEQSIVNLKANHRMIRIEDERHHYIVHMWQKHMVIDHSSGTCTYGGRNWAYFCSTGSSFWDTGQFLKLPYLGMKLGKWPKFQTLNIYSLYIPRGRNWGYFRSIGNGFWDTANFQNCHIWVWHFFGKWSKFQKLHIYNLNYSWIPNFNPICSTVTLFTDN